MRNLYFVSGLLVFILILIPVRRINASLPQNDTIKIGLLISNSKSLSARNGAEMALLNDETTNGKGLPVKIIVRSMEGPWGTGSNQAVDLIFKEKVCALLGSHDGRNAHLVEQVATKAKVVFVSAWSGDPTLSQAFVPWFFNCVPNDQQQALVLIKEIYDNRKLQKIAVISDNSYDSKMALSSFVKCCTSTGIPEPIEYNLDNSDPDYKLLTDKINKTDIKGIILFGQTTASLKLISTLRQRKMNQIVFGSLSLSEGSEIYDQQLKSYENIVMISPEFYFTLKGRNFIDEFHKLYGYIPGPEAAYAYDGINVIIKAVRSAGTYYQNIQKAIVSSKYEGVTGTFKFDEKGNRIGNIDFMKVENGHPVLLEKN